MRSTWPRVILFNSHMISGTLCVTAHYCCKDTTPNVLLTQFIKMTIVYPYRSSRSRSIRGPMIHPDICHDLYYYHIKFGWATINIKGTRGKNVFLALVDMVTYLIRKVGHGQNFWLSPMLMSYGAMQGVKYFLFFWCTRCTPNLTKVCTSPIWCAPV